MESIRMGLTAVSGARTLRSRSIRVPSFCLLLLLCLSLFQCRGDKPEGLTPEEKDLLVETTALLSLAAQEHAGNPDHLAVQQDSIFSSLGMNREDYHRLVEKMSRRPEGWLEVWERIAEQIEDVSGNTS